MTCREIIEFLVDYLNQELPERERVLLENHLEICPPCVAYLHTYKEAILLGKKCLCEGDSPIEPVPEDLVRAILEARAKSQN